MLLSTGNPSGTTLSFTGLSGKNKYFLQVYDVKAQSVNGSMLIRFNSDSGSNYSAIGTELTAAGSLSITSITGATAVFSNPLFAIKTNANALAFVLMAKSGLLKTAVAPVMLVILRLPAAVNSVPIAE